MALTLEEIQRTLETVEFRRSVIAFVCRPEIARRLRDIAELSELPSLGLFGNAAAGVEVLTDHEQPEPCLAFFDRDALREYLARNRVCATPGCGARCVRWHSYADGAFYCEPCADKITAANPNLPGFNDCQFVKV